MSEAIRKEKKIRQLLCRLTAEELDAAVQDMVENVQEVNSLKVQLDEAKAEWSETKKGLEKQIEFHEKQLNKATGLVSTGEQAREVDCEAVFDYEHDKLTVTRLDTGEVIEERGLQATERQMHLGLDEDPDMCPDGCCECGECPDCAGPEDEDENETDGNE
jgi:hypothetical protein